ncbi:NTP transferase domain-containing protein [Vogesella sp.]|uniref:phosphocholine cytidylyltransferase family protein n=1 Tax=Vogesella sp. TaxID=1904252 RepID=UPI00391A44D4
MLPRLAVILAAGRGERFGDQGKLHPKGFIDLGDGPIVKISIDKLIAAGISKVIVVSGHLAPFYQSLAKQYPGVIDLVHNPSYAQSGSMFSLACAAHSINEDFLLLESDLIYDRKALEHLANASSPDVVLVSGATSSQDEVYVEADQGFLKNLSKNRCLLSSEPVGELVGISRVSMAFFSHMMDYSLDVFKQTKHLEYESALVAASAVLPMQCLKIEDLAWSEIDTKSHLERAILQVYPSIKARECP